MTVEWVSQLGFSKGQTLLLPNTLKLTRELKQVFNRLKNGLFTGMSDCGISGGN